MTARDALAATAFVAAFLGLLVVTIAKALVATA